MQLNEININIFLCTLTCFAVSALPSPVTVAIVAGRQVRAVVRLVPTIATVCSSWVLAFVMILTITSSVAKLFLSFFKVCKSITDKVFIV